MVVVSCVSVCSCSIKVQLYCILSQSSYRRCIHDSCHCVPVINGKYIHSYSQFALRINYMLLYSTTKYDEGRWSCGAGQMTMMNGIKNKQLCCWSTDWGEPERASLGRAWASPMLVRWSREIMLSSVRGTLVKRPKFFAISKICCHLV